MRIGIVCHASMGGSGLVATNLALGLAKKGHQIHLISSAMPFKLTSAQINITFHCVEGVQYPLFEGSLYTFALTAKIVEVVETADLDLVHAHYSIPHSLCAYLASKISSRTFPMLTTIHGTDATIVGQNKQLFPLNKFSIEHSDKVTTVSHFQKKYITEQFKVNDNIEVIHNFIDVDIFKPSNANLTTRRKLAYDDEKIVMHISNFRPVKNTAAVVSTFYTVQARVKAKLVLVGSGPDVSEVRKQCDALGISDQVVFLGDITDVENVIANADCLLQPSLRESFSLVALEAMASGVPAVTSNVDGIPEVVEHGVTGFMTDPNNIDMLAKYVSKILTDSSLQIALGKQGRLRAKKCFSWAPQINKYLHCYQMVMLDHQDQIRKNLEGTMSE